VAIGAALVAADVAKAASLQGYTCRNTAQVNNVLPFDKLIHLRTTETATAWTEEHDIGELVAHL
jgi:hypothetical protein